MAQLTHTNQECVRETFRPCAVRPVRWLEWEADYPLALAAWRVPLSHEAWLGFRRDGYRYCAAVEGGRIVALAGLWRYSARAWEVAGVVTRESRRRVGYGASVVSFVTESILAHVPRATCLTAADNVPMQRTAARVGFYFAPR